MIKYSSETYVKYLNLKSKIFESSSSSFGLTIFQLKLEVGKALTILVIALVR